MLFATFSFLLGAADVSAATAPQIGTGILVLIAVTPLLSLVVGVIALVMGSRRTPPIAEEVYKQFIPRAEHNESLARVEHRIDGAFEEINSVRTQMTKAYGDFERALGRVEGALKDNQ